MKLIVIFSFMFAALLVFTGVLIAGYYAKAAECEELGGVMYRSVCLEEDAVLIG